MKIPNKLGQENEDGFSRGHDQQSNRIKQIQKSQDGGERHRWIETGKGEGRKGEARRKREEGKRKGQQENNRIVSIPCIDQSDHPIQWMHGRGVIRM